MALRRFRSLGTAALLVLLSWPGFGVAEMLDGPACNALKNEQARLAAEGLKTEMLHGPDWAKANLPASRLEQIKHLIEVEEQIAFRCPLPPPPKPVEPAAAAAPADGDPQAKPSKKRKKKDSGEAAVSEPAADDAATPPPAKRKQKPKKKKEPVNDAFVPAPTMGNAFVNGEAGPVAQPVQPAPKLSP